MTEKKLESATAKILAYSLVALYSIALSFIGVVAAFQPSNDGNAWLELFKSGFLVLGGSLTTIIGYYFGSRGVEKAQDVAEIARRGFEENAAELEKAKAELAPTSDEGSLQLPTRG